MKNLVKVTSTLVLCVAMVVAFSGAVRATGAQSLFANTNETTSNNSVDNNTISNNTASNNTTASNAPILTPTTPNITNNTVNNVVNNTPKKQEETIPKTGENDIFIVLGVGIIALAIGAVAYRNSKKYSL